MQMHYEIHGKSFSLVIKDLAPQYHQVVQNTGYTLTDEGFVCTIVPPDAASLQPAYLDKIIVNAQQTMEVLLSQRAGLTPVPWEEALLKYLALIEEHDINWWLVGSTALAVRGLDVHPGDIDLCTSEVDALKVQNLLIDYVIQPLEDATGWAGKWFGRSFPGARLEWIGGVNASVDAEQITDFGPIAQARMETIQWRGYEIGVPPLDLQWDVSVRRGLTDRAEKIRQAMR